MNITIQIDDKEHPIDDGVHDVFVESADVVRIRRENEKLAVDSVVLDKIIEVVDKVGRPAMYPVLHATLEEITAIIDERGD